MSVLPKPIDAKVAVLICLYAGDRESWFQEAVDSIINQTIGSDRIQIYLGIDGPVSQEMEDFLTCHKDHFYKTVRNRRNEGLTRTLNHLIVALEDEEFIFRLDADDICLPTRFSQQVTFLQENPDVDVLGGAIWEFTDEASVYWKKNYPTRHEEIKRYITRANPLAHSTVCFRKRFFEKVPAYPDSFRINQDLALWNAALRKGVKFANLEQPVVCLRTSPEFFSRRGFARAKSEFQLYMSATFYHYGFTWRMVLPFLRFFLRFLPAPIARRIYTSSLRNWLSRR